MSILHIQSYPYVLIVYRPAAQKRKLIIYGDPSFESTPTPSFVANLVFGGPLEQIRCLDNKAEVTFLDGIDAQRFFDATPNGILYRKDAAAGNRYAEVKFIDEVTPVASLVKQHLENGATRCVRAIGIDEDWTVAGLQALAGGKSSRTGLPMRKIESVEIGVNERNVRFLDPFISMILDADFDLSIAMPLSASATSVMR